MTGITQAQHAIAQLAERFTPELKRRIITFTIASLVMGFFDVWLLWLSRATYDPFVWTVLVVSGAAYGWFAHEQLVRDELWSVIDDCEAYIAMLEAQLEENEEEV